MLKNKSKLLVQEITEYPKSGVSVHHKPSHVLISQINGRYWTPLPIFLAYVCCEVYDYYIPTIYIDSQYFTDSKKLFSLCDFPSLVL